MMHSCMPLQYIVSYIATKPQNYMESLKITSVPFDFLLLPLFSFLLLPSQNSHVVDGTCICPHFPWECMFIVLEI